MAMTWPNQITGASNRPASPLDGGPQFVSARCVLPSLSAAVAQFCRCGMSHSKHLSQSFWIVLLLLFSQMVAQQYVTAAETNQIKRLAAQEAFRIAIEALDGRVNLLSKDGLMKFQRGERGCWHLCLTHYPGQPKSSLRVIVWDDGSVEQLDHPFGEPNKSPSAQSLLRAFTLVAESLASKYDLFDARGRVGLHRTDDDKWYADAIGYRGMPIGSAYFYVQDDGKFERGWLF